jgi:glutathione S-transferase
LHGLVELLERAEQEVVDGGGFSSASEKKTLGLGLGLWIEGNDLGLTDVMVGPCAYDCLISSPVAEAVTLGIYRANNVLKHYRGFVLPPGKKFDAWVERLLNHPAFKATCSDEKMYIEWYER